jgi:chromosome segregation ATPase
MSASDVDVMQKKPDDTPVIWREYEALRDHLERIITRTTDAIDSDIQAVQMKVEVTDATVNNMQVQVNDLQTSIQALTQSVNALRLTIEQ